MLSLPTYIEPKLIFPLKGCFYYDAWLALEYDLLDKNSTLILRQEPTNKYDLYAIQVWLQFTGDDNDKEDQTREMLIGYVPRILSRYMSQRIVELGKRHIEIEPLQIAHLAHHGRSIEIDCLWPQINLDLIADEDDFVHRMFVVAKLYWLHRITQLKRWWRKKQSQYHHKPQN